MWGRTDRLARQAGCHFGPGPPGRAPTGVQRPGFPTRVPAVLCVW